MDRNRVIGVDLGGTKILAAIVDREGTPHERVVRPTPTGSQEEVLRGLEDAVEALRDDTIAAIGFGVPSRIDHAGGRAIGSVNIPLDGFPLRDRMRDRFGLPVGLENDGNAATFAEWRHGAGRGADDLAMLTLGTGVGGGVVFGGNLYRGWAELGHLVVLAGGPPCQGICTGHGHLESLVSGHAADGVAREVLGEGTTARDLVERGHAGDEAAVEALASIGRLLGAGIGSIVNVFGVELVLVGGGFGSAAGDLLLGPALEVARVESLTPARGRLRIVPAALGSDAGVLGAALVAFEALDGAR